MKTEKRLTMALSVLVALMMLAVPLASSSNLFVDGGQTNSNGDAPLLSAGETASYDITFKLNADDKSLDQPKLYGGALPTTPNGVKWYLDENGDIHAIVPKNTKLGEVINALYRDDAGKYVSSVEKDGYTLDVWKNEANGAVYKYNATADKTPITSNMTFSAQWLLNDNYCEIPVIVDYKGEVKEYVKAYQYDDTQKKIIVPEAGLLTDGISDIDTYGIIVNAKNEKAEIVPAIEKVYSFKATYGDNKEFEFTGTDVKTATISADSKITIKYSFNNDKYSEIVVSSIAFKDGKDVTLYADKIRSYSYVNVYNALVFNFSGDANKDMITNLPILTLADSKDNLTKDGYKLTGWNEGAQLLKSENNASSPLTLDAELNGYYVIFMSKGQSEYVYVPFGELKADKTTLSIDGVNHWVWMKYTDYNAGTFTATGENKTINSFNFASTSDKDLVEAEADGKTPAAVLIACFTPSSSTSYAVFDASSYKYTFVSNPASIVTTETEGTFGNEYVQYLIIPGKVGDKISVPSIAPVYDEELKMLFISWNHKPVIPTENVTAAPTLKPYSSEDNYTSSITEYYANAVSYKHTITFYDGDKVIGVFYYGESVPTNENDLKTLLVAFEYDGKVYDAKDLALGDKTDAYKSAQKAYNSILVPSKDGYTIKQWNDANKNKIIDVVDGSADKITADIKDMKDDLSLYAQFEPKSYTIKYINAFGGEQTQKVKVDQNVTLYGKGTFIQEGFELAGWSTVPGAGGDEYKLEGTFVLNGADYEKLASASSDGKTVVIELYSIWEFGGVTPGDNTEGGDNTALYLIAGMLLVIAVLGIAALFLLRRKN